MTALISFSCGISERTNQFPRKYLTSVWEDIVAQRTYIFGSEIQQLYCKQSYTNKVHTCTSQKRVDHATMQKIRISSYGPSEISLVGTFEVCQVHRVQSQEKRI